MINAVEKRNKSEKNENSAKGRERVAHLSKASVRT